MRYTAWGEVRYSWASSQSTTPAYSLPDYTYTGQFSNMEDFGLLFYNARMYDPAIGRFISADTVPGFDRYQYVNNNPLRFTDPSGHKLCVGFNEYGNCIAEPKSPHHDVWVTFSKDDGAADWTDADKEVVEQAAQDIGTQLLRMWRSEMRELYRSGDLSAMPEEPSARKLYLDVFGVVDFHRLSSSDCECWGEYHSTSQVYIYAHANINSSFAGTRFIVHELGHVFDNRYELDPRNAVTSGWQPGAQFPLPHRSQNGGDAYGGFAGPFEGWQQSKGTGQWEEFADMFVGWVYGRWWTGDGDAGTQRSNFMDHYMPMWVNLTGN